MKPKVILHSTTSLDGRISGFVPDIGLYYELAQEWREDATLVGCETILVAREEEGAEASGAEETKGASDPLLEEKSSLPLLAVTDSRGRVDD